MLKTVLLAACVLITASSSAQSTCPDTTSKPLTGTYEKPSDSRYLFLSSSRSTYHDAVASCSMRGGKLYSLPSLPDTSFTEMLGKYSGVGAQGYILNNGSQCLGSTSGSPGVGNCIKIYRTSSAAAFSCSSTGCCDKLQFICEVPEACMYCSLNGTCTDSGNCSCNAGYKREGITCIDINECSANPCLASQVCVNTLGSHRCADEYRTIIDQRVGAYNGSKEWTDMYDSNIQNATKMAWVGVTGYQRQTSASLLVYDDILVARYTVLHITQNGNVSDLIRSYKTKHGDVFFSDFDLETPVEHNQNCCASCGPNKSCTSRLGEVTCKCQIGFTSSSSEDMDSCDDIDECANSTKFSCPAHSACKNTLGSYYCGECLKGYTGSPHNCSDINECTSGTHNCSSNSFCVNTNGSYICNCPTGYSGIHCTNIDGCLAANLRCNESQFCDKQDGSFVCRVGYPRRFDQLLAGLNASDFNNKTSDSYTKMKTMITNDLQTLWNVSNGMVQVSDFFSSGGKMVVRYDVYTFDIHEFHKDLIASYVSRNTVTPKYPYQAEVPKAYFNCCGSCGQNAKCQTFLGNVSCQCLSGFYGSPPNCTDNQCLTSSSPCSSNANCTKTGANYSCACHSGFVGNGTFCYPLTCKTAHNMCHHNALCKQDGKNWNCECKPGFYGDPISNCTDIDECTDDDGKCHQNASCTNNIGNYTCSCRTGFNGNGSFCEDIDECSTNVSNCHHKATCNNTVGSYTCICMTGYYKNGTGCFDIDECKGSSHKCNRSASCRNTPGSYNCSCNSGYNGDGFTCDDENECDEAIPRCHTNATCINKPGSYECKCKDGFDGNGTHSCIDRNECAGGNCHQNASCINEVNGFTCVCNSGFTGNGTSCTDTDECSNSTLNQCHVNATCVNTPGSHHCSCMSGFSGSGEDCQDINECENKTDNCDSNANCSNNVGSFTCTCHDGFHGNGSFCTDINECENKTDNCGSNANCTNNVGSFTCTCHDGFHGNGSFCTDIDECSNSSLNGCHTNATCHNQPGSYNCTCKAGFTGDGKTCRDVKECLNSTLNQCHVNATCVDTPGSHHCSCVSGFSGSGEDCQDINECENKTDNCDSNANCTNNVGSFTCTCHDGFHGNGSFCTDIDECSNSSLNKCHTNATCHNIPGSYNCTCKTGFTGDGKTCEDVKECLNSTLNQCHVNATCVDTPGSHHCSCVSGFSGSGEDCQDINECENKTDNCDSNANCTNNVGSFTCTCHDGFHGNGSFCTDIDECSNSSLNECHTNATCHNGPGSYNCTCKAGFTGDGKTCRDKNECTGKHVCPPNSNCTNTHGSYACICIAGFFKNGTMCSDINECETGNFSCHANAECINAIGTYCCVCKQNFTGHGSNCTELDCSNGGKDCSSNGLCMLKGGKHVCKCNMGYKGDGYSCTDINECTNSSKNSCHIHANCTNTIGDYSCRCHAGYTGNGVKCTKLDCSNGGNVCSSNGSCISNRRKHICACNMGYQGDGYSCIDTNECLDSSKNSCHIHANCTNTVGSYSCMCHAGYTGNGKICTEINECEHANCSSTSTCVDRVDGYTCVCKDGFTGKNCTDIDECKNASVICEQNEMCVNNDGSYMCICKPGYATSNCTDVNECNNGEAKCHSNATCNNTMGNYTCTCYTGFIGDGYNCIDRNECSADNACSANATCTNHGGGYTCTCKSGFSGDGHTCTDINECSSNPCHENAYCNNTDGSYTCTCKKDYSGDGKSCQLLLHCSTNGVFECHKYASCVSDNNGQYSCKCNPGFQGDGTTCSGICNLQVYQNLTFNETQVPFVQASNEKCSNGLSKATAVCTPGTNGLFSFAKLKSIPCNASLLSLENGNAEETTATIQVLTSHAENISTSEVSVVVDYFVNITDNNQNETISTATFYSAASISSNLITKFFKTPDTPNNKENTKLRNNLVQSLTKLARSVELEPDDPLVVETDTVVIKVLQSSTDTTTLRFKPVVTSGNNITRTPVNVVLPSTVLQKAWGTTATRAKRETNGGRASFMLYIDDSLFPSSSNVTTVVEIDLGVEFVTGLQDPVKIEHYDKGGTLYGQTETEDTFTVVETVYSCEYWDFNKNDWSSEGCCFNYTSNPPECLCSHLTNFALIMKNNNAPADLALSVISDIGCILSIIGLFATIVIHAEDRDLRRRRPTKILLNICGNLMIAYLIFVVGIDHPKQKNACIAVTYLLHYFFLTSWCWMSVYSYDMYMSLVKVFRGNEHNFLQWCSLFAYGTPLVIASITVGVTVGYLDNLPQAVKNNLCGDVIDPLKKSTYHASNICWLNGPALYIGFLIPITICFVGNFAIFVCVLKEIIEKNSKVEVSSMKRTVKQNMIFAVTMTSIMGLTWVFGYLLLLSDNEAYLTAMSWIFALFNTLQGVGIFVLTAMRRPRFRKLWKNSTSAVTSSHALSVFRGTDTLRSEDASTATTDMNHRE